MDLPSDPQDIALKAFIAGVDYAEVTLGGSIPLGEVKDAFEKWLNDLSR